MSFEDEFPSIRSFKLNENVRSFILKSPEIQEAIRVISIDKQKVGDAFYRLKISTYQDDYENIRGKIEDMEEELGL